MLMYPMSTCRNFDEVLRLLDSVQLTVQHTVETPVNWQPGQDVSVCPNQSFCASDADYRTNRYPELSTL